MSTYMERRRNPCPRLRHTANFYDIPVFHLLNAADRPDAALAAGPAAGISCLRTEFLGMGGQFRGGMVMSPRVEHIGEAVR